ncbi:MAG: trimethylamine methyltransferase family protein [Pirellulales bacterium]|nr:trimethylamine methyltransferase family protein [Pirellulales bacterium]
MSSSATCPGDVDSSSNTKAQREGVLVAPQQRLDGDQIRLIDGLSREMLEDPGVLCYNKAAAEIFSKADATVEPADGCVRIKIPSSVIDTTLGTAPSRIVLGARCPENRLILDALEPRVRFGSGAETNFWLDVQFDGPVPRFVREAGSIERLRQSAHLCDQLEQLDFFIRNVNIQDAEITEANKDVNQFTTSLNNITKHVQAGLTSLDALDDVVRLGQIVAGGPEAFSEEPVISFITCVIKSPLQFVDDTTEKLIEIAKRRVPVVISSCPMGGATGPFDEFGMVAQINAELLAGIALQQLASPGAPVLYGAVPVRTRLDNLNDMYAAAEFVQYNVDCAQMARFYELPCYSTAGVGDASVPGVQATIEKMLTLTGVPQAGAQYIHYAFGLLERTNVFCPEQAILDDVQIDLIKRTIAPPAIDTSGRESVLSLVREIMDSSHKTYMYHIPLPSRDAVYARFPLEDEQGALHAAHLRRQELAATPRQTLPSEIQDEIRRHVPNLLDKALA